jgi:hypothetical protein
MVSSMIQIGFFGFDATEAKLRLRTSFRSLVFWGALRDGNRGQVDCWSQCAQEEGRVGSESKEKFDSEED